jgi:uncharacterized protein (TIGR02444 family)
MAEADELFWTFSASFYARPGVASACIGLQDGHGLDVNVALYACWLGLSGRGRLSQADLTGVKESNAPWRAGVIDHLRAARRTLKDENRPGAVATLYEAVKVAELAAERIAQRRLELLAPPSESRSATERAAAAAANLTLYVPGTARETAAPIFAAIEAAAREAG